MDIITGAVAVAGIISAAITICTVHRNNTQEAQNARNDLLRRETLAQQRNEDQQRAEVRAAEKEGYANGVAYCTSSIHTALDAVKAPQVVVQS